MQLDVGSEPYLSTAQALCLFISHTLYYKSFVTFDLAPIQNGAMTGL